MSRRFFFSALGAGLFFVLDSLHVHVGIWRAGAERGVPWWYFFIYLAGIFATASLLRLLERPLRVAPGAVRLRVDIGAFVALLAAHLLFFESEVLLALFSLVFLVARLVLLPRRGDLAIGLGIAALDAAVEWSMARRGLFAYSHARFALLPLWLLPFWAGLGVSIRGFFLAVEPVERGR